MSRSVTALLLLLCCPFVSGDEDKGKIIQAKDARKHLDEERTVEMVVKTTKDSKNRRTYFLDSEDDFRSETNLAIVIDYEDADKFHKAGIEDPAAHYRGKTIRVTGKILAESNQVRMHVQDPSHIKIVDQAAAASPPGQLTVKNLDGKVTVFSAAQIAKLPRQKSQVKSPGGPGATFEGVSLAEILQRVEVPLGKHSRGPLLASYVLIEGSDGYRVIFSLAELDPALTDHIVLLAERKDGKPLDAAEGPYRLIVPHDKLHSRWVKQVSRIVVQQVSTDSPKPKK